MLTDSPELRTLLAALLPGLAIESTPRASGQRVVYFCSFQPAAGRVAKSQDFHRWGPVVLKASEGIHASQVAYLQKEIDVLNSLKSAYYPRLHFHETFSEDPRTGDALSQRLFVTIEERVAAQPLSDLKGKYRDEALALGLLLSLVEALKPLWQHTQKLVHRDIKPDNILVRSDGSVVIIDLGIVREQGAVGLTSTHALYGPCTPLYASPEQASNDKANITFKSDFFALGVLAYELVSGTHPFADAANAEEVFQHVKTTIPISLTTTQGASKKFSDVIEKMMQKEPYKRHRTIEHLLQELEQCKKS